MANDDRPRNKSYFDFVICERPQYIPGSGPPPLPLTVLPVHDRDGIILKYYPASLTSHSRYIVTYENERHLVVSVKPEDILDWVSARTYEDFEYEKALETEKAEEAAREQRRKAKEEREERKRKLREEWAHGSGRARVDSLRTSQLGKIHRPRGRPVGWRKHSMVVSTIEESASPDVESGKITPSMPPSQPSLSKPPLPATHRGRGLADPVITETDTDDYDDAMEDTLNAQLFGSSVVPSLEYSESSPDPLNFSGMPSSARSIPGGYSPILPSNRSHAVAQEDAKISRQGRPPILPPGRNRLDATQGNAKTRRKEAKPVFTPKGVNLKAAQRSTSRLSASRASSLGHRQNPRIVKSLSSSQNKDSVMSSKSFLGKRPNRSPKNGANLAKGSSLSNTALRTTGNKTHAGTPNGVKYLKNGNDGAANGKGKQIVESRGGDEEPEWAVKRILDDEFDQAGSRRYLIDWKGNYEPTWEPEGNINVKVIRKYKKSKKRREFRKQRWNARQALDVDGAADEDAPPSGLDSDDELDLRENYASPPVMFVGRPNSHGADMLAELGKGKEVFRGEP